MAKGQILYTDNLNEVKRRADSLHTSLKEVKKDAESLKTLKSTDGIFNNAFKGINNINKGLKEVRDSMKGLNQESKTYQNLQKIENQYLYQRKKIYSDLQEYVKLMTNLENSQAKKEGEILQNLINRNKEQQQINNSIAASERILQRINNFEQQRTTEIKNQQKELDKLHKKAQEVGSMTKSILQDKNLNQKGAKDTAAQWDYQRDAIQRTAVEIRNAKDAGEAYRHMLESMVYEVKHTTGKGLFQDAIDGTNKLINLENKRFEAQKSGKQIMEKYYDAEIRKQKELISNIMDEANNPQKLQSLLKDNANYIKNLLPEDMQADFQQQFEKTGMIDKAWAEGMNKYVIALQQAYQEQVKLNQAKSQQNTQDTSYKTLKADLQEVWNLENRIAQLSKDPKHHLSEIQYLQQLVANKKQTLNYDERIKNLSKDQVVEIKNAEQAQKQLNGQIKAQGKDWGNNNKKVTELGDTIKKVFNYIVVYRGFQMLQQGIQQAIDTMKELDKAFTDIQMVTGDTDEQTAELAQNYNVLAKEMGSTTKEVAEGASEWFNESRDHLKTLELLETCEG